MRKLGLLGLAAVAAFAVAIQARPEQRDVGPPQVTAVAHQLYTDTGAVVPVATTATGVVVVGQEQNAFYAEAGPPMRASPVALHFGLPRRSLENDRYFESMTENGTLDDRGTNSHARRGQVYLV